MHAISINDKRVGNRFIVAGHKTRGFRVEAHEKGGLLPCIYGTINHALTLAHRRDTRHVGFSGGGARIRTGVEGFAGPCLTTRPRRQK